MRDFTPAIVYGPRKKVKLNLIANLIFLGKGLTTQRVELVSIHMASNLVSNNMEVALNNRYSLSVTGWTNSILWWLNQKK